MEVPLLGGIGDVPTMMMMFLALLRAAHIVDVKLDVRVDEVRLSEIDLLKHEGVAATSARLHFSRNHLSGMMVVMVMMMPNRVSGHPHHPVALRGEWRVTWMAALWVSGRQSSLRPCCGGSSFLTSGVVL